MNKLKITLALLSCVFLMAIFRGIYLLVASDSSVRLENTLTRKNIQTGLVSKSNLEALRVDEKRFKYFIDPEEAKCSGAIVVNLKTKEFNKNLTLDIIPKTEQCVMKLEKVSTYNEMMMAKIFKEWSRLDVKSVFVYDLTLLSDELTSDFINKRFTHPQQLLDYIDTKGLDTDLKNLFVGFGMTLQERKLVAVDNASESFKPKVLKYEANYISQEGI